MKHTVLNWKANDMPLPARGFIRIENAAGHEIARVYKPDRLKYYGRKQLPEDMQGDIALICAAPRMLEALKKWITDADAVSNLIGFKPSEGSAAWMAKQVLASLEEK
jgi:hypothetical protein